MALVLIFLRDAVNWASHGLSSMPNLVISLRGKESDYSDELDAAIKSRFPVGTSEERLLADLKAEGFTPDWRERDALNSASFVHEGLLCRKIARVTWRGDHEGRLTQVGGSYASQCEISSPFTQSGKPHARNS